MGAALALSLLYLALLSLDGQTHRWLQTAGMVAARVLLLLFPPAARDALSLLNCTAASVSLTGCSSLDGCTGGGSGSRGRGSTVAVRVLVSNPYYVCWAPGAAHITAGGVAAATIVFVVVAFPAATCWAVWRESGRGRRKAGLLAAQAGTSGFGGANEASTVVVNPMRRQGVSGPETQPGRRPGVWEGAPEQKMLAPFLSDYRPEAWYTRHADLGLTLLLAALQVRLLACACPACLGTLTVHHFSSRRPLSRTPRRQLRSWARRQPSWFQRSRLLCTPSGRAPSLPPTRGSPA